MLVIIYFYNGLNRFSNTLLKLHQSVVQNLYDMWCSNFEICMAQLHCTVTEITALNCCSCVNRSPVQHDFRGSAKLFSIATVNIHRSLPCNFWEFFLGFFDNIYHDNTCRSLLKLHSWWIPRIKTLLLLFFLFFLLLLLILIWFIYPFVALLEVTHWVPQNTPVYLSVLLQGKVYLVGGFWVSYIVVPVTPCIWYLE